MRKYASGFLKYLILVFFGFLSLYPFLWVVITSFKDNNAIYGDPLGLPVNPMIENYSAAWAGAEIGRNFVNSMMVCLATLCLLILITAMGSYVLMRVWRLPFMNLYLSLGIMVPVHALLIPAVLLFKKLHMTDQLGSLVLIYTAANISFSMFILNGFFRHIPQELDEAAFIDGCSRTQVFFRIILPVAKPGIATVATLTFLNCWNDLLLSLVLISSPQKKTLSVAISALKGSYNTQYGLLCAGFVISIIPVVVMYLLFQKQVIAGMTAGAVKG